jgi:cytochrome c oxidase cbb3-type subunit II
VLLGDMRIGPDLVDVGARIAKTIDNTLLLHLYDPRITTPGSIMPPFAFLFTTQKMGNQPSANALKFVNDSPGPRPAEGYEVVPTARAIALVAYLRSLNIDYDLPELHNVAVP